MPKYTDEDIRNMSKITCKIAADYLGISPMAVSIGMRNDLLPIGFAIHNEERDRTYSESWSYHIIGERLIAYKYGKTSEVQVQNIEKSLNTIIESTLPAFSYQLHPIIQRTPWCTFITHNETSKCSKFLLSIKEVE